MRTHELNTRRNGERGVALLLTMFALVIVAAIGFSMMFQTDTETAINSNFRDQQSAYYAAAAGLEEARDRMASDAGTGVTISASLPAVLANQTAGVLYITNTGETIQPWNNSNTYIDNELCSQTVNDLTTRGETDCSGAIFPTASNWYASVSANSAYAANPVIPYKWSRITLKQNRSAAGTSNTLYVDGNSSHANYYVCSNGAHEFASSNACVRPVYLATTLAVTPSGTRRMLQYELTRTQLITGPGALTLLGPSVAASMPSSNGFGVDGNDHAGCGITATSGAVPGISVQSSTVDTYVTGQIPSNRLDNYTGSGGTSGDVQAVEMPVEYQSVAALEALIAQIRTSATYYSSNPGSINLGTSASPVINYVDGDLSLGGNTTGYGILIVRGRYTAGGNVGWNGIIFVVGKGEVYNNGGGNNTYYGALVVAKTLDNSLNTLSSFGSPTFDWSGGGGNGIRYSSGCTQQQDPNNIKKDYRVLASRELMY